MPFAHEVDGYGNEIFMDDANIPSLLSLPYLGYVAVADEAYQVTRRGVLSAAHNPYFFNGTVAQGVGSPHTGLGNVWYMSIIMQALTSTDDGEVSAEEVLRVINALGENVAVDDASSKDVMRISLDDVQAAMEMLRTVQGRSYTNLKPKDFERVIQEEKSGQPVQ